MNLPYIFVSVDVMNLWYTGRYEFGDGTRISYSSLVDLLNRRFPMQTLRLYAYVVTSTTKLMPDGKIKGIGRRNERFVKQLENIGFVVKDRIMVAEKNAAKPFGTDWDVGITVDALKHAKSFSTFVLVSGDGDYTPLLAELKNQGKRVVVVTFESSTSKLLHQEADEVIYLSENEVFNTGTDYGESQKGPR